MINVFSYMFGCIYHWYNLTHPFYFSKLLEKDLKANGVKEEGGDVTVIEGLWIIIDICRTFLSSYIHYLVNYSLFST